MTNKKLVLFVLTPIIMLLLVLYVMSSTDLIFKEVQEKIYKISILIPDINDTSWQNFNKGADFAAKELNVDLKKVTLFDWNDPVQEQLKQMESEINLEAQGVIISPLNYSKSIDYLDSLSTKEPLVFCKTVLEGHNPDYQHIFYDNQAVGKVLSAKIKEDIKTEGYEVLIITSREKYERDQNYIAGIIDGFGLDTVIKEHIISNIEESEKLIAEIGRNKSIIIGLDTYSVELMAEVVNEYTPLYGIGFTSDSLNDLENSKIKALACFDDYYAGYLSVVNVVEQIERGKDKTSEITIPFKIVTKDNMFTQEIEKFIFPLG